MASAAAPSIEQKLSRNPGMIGMVIFGVALVVVDDHLTLFLAMKEDVGNIQHVTTAASNVCPC